MEEINPHRMDHDEIVERIRAIMRLMRFGATEGERQAASAAASRLAKKAGLDLDDIAETDSRISTKDDCDGKKYIKHALETAYITPILRTHFGVVLVRFNVPESKDLATYHYIGTALNIDIARYVFDILMRESRAAWRETNKAVIYAQELMRQGIRRKGADKIAGITKRAFYDGWFFEINRRMTEKPLRNDADQFEAERLAAEARFEKLKTQMNIEESNEKSDSPDRTSVMLGIQAAEKISISRPFSEKSNSRSAIPSPIIGAISLTSPKVSRENKPKTKGNRRQ